MKHILLISLTSFFTCILPPVFYSAFDVFVLGNCSSKFGCFGGFQFFTIIAATYAGICTFLSFLAILTITKKHRINPTYISVNFVLKVAVFLNILFFSGLMIAGYIVSFWASFIYVNSLKTK